MTSLAEKLRQRLFGQPSASALTNSAPIRNSRQNGFTTDPFEGTEQLSAFMFYVKDKYREFEGRPLQGMPYNPQWDPNTIPHTLENLRAAHGVTNP